MIQLNSPEATHKFYLPLPRLVEYGDYSCLRCQVLQPILGKVLPQFDGKIIYEFRHFPDLSHPRAFLMALMAEAARYQGKFSAMHTTLFAQRHPISIQAVPVFAKGVGLNVDWFMADLHDEAVIGRVWADIALARHDGVLQTPTLFLGSHRLHGKLTQARLIPLVNQYVNRSSPLVREIPVIN